MHTVMVIGGGLVLLAILAFGARLFGGDIGPAVKLFVPLWLVATLVNMWIGVSRAGYPVSAEAPIALVSIVEDVRQRFLARTGLDAEETPRDVSFCAHAMLGRDIFVVPDAAAEIPMPR